MIKDISKFRCCLNKHDLNIESVKDFCVNDTNRISGKIAQVLAVNSPWMSVIDPYFKLRMDAAQLIESWKILKKHYKKTK